MDDKEKDIVLSAVAPYLLKNYISIYTFDKLVELLRSELDERTDKAIKNGIEQSLAMRERVNIVLPIIQSQLENIGNRVNSTTTSVGKAYQQSNIAHQQMLRLEERVKIMSATLENDIVQNESLIQNNENLTQEYIIIVERLKEQMAHLYKGMNQLHDSIFGETVQGLQPKIARRIENNEINMKDFHRRLFVAENHINDIEEIKKKMEIVDKYIKTQTMIALIFTNTYIKTIARWQQLKHIIWSAIRYTVNYITKRVLIQLSIVIGLMVFGLTANDETRLFIEGLIDSLFG